MAFSGESIRIEERALTLQAEGQFGSVTGQFQGFQELNTRPCE